MLTRNEEHALPRALASLPPGVRLFVLDAESDDATVAIARAAGARVERRPWTGFVSARRHALAQVETPWAFMLDADERLDPALAQALVDAADDVAGYVVRRTTLFCGRPVRQWRDEPLLRVFRPERARLEARPASGGSVELHERWLVDGPAGALAGTLLHDSYPTRASYRRKFARYTALEAEGLRTSPARLAAVALLALARFARQLALRGALLDGWRGVYVAFWSALYPVAAHLRALRR